MRDQSTKVIDNKKLLFTQISPRALLPIYTFLIKLLGNTLSSGAGSIKDLKQIKTFNDLLDSTNVDLEKLLKAISGALTEIDDNPKLESHIDKLLESVIYNGQTLSLDHSIFQGKLSLLNKVLIEAIKVNFSDFLKGSEGIEGMLDKTASQDTISE